MTIDAESPGIERAELMDLAQRAVRQLTTTELHGAACGVLAGGGGADDLLQLLGPDALSDSTSLTDYWRANAVYAFDEDMRFAPMLPTDEEAGLACLLYTSDAADE